MIVECRSCTTRFQLDESRIPVAGIRVRCSKCKEAFFLEHPSASRAEAIDELAREAIDAAGVRAPDSTQDLIEPPLADDRFDDDEEDWEFNHDVPLDEAPSGTRRARPRSAAKPAAAKAAPSAIAESASASDAEDASGSFGNVDDFGSLGGDADEDLAPAASPAPARSKQAAKAAPVKRSGRKGAPSIAAAIDSFTTPRSTAAPAAAGAARTAGNASSELPSEFEADLGEPEEWDLLGEDLPQPEVQSAKVARAPEATTHMRSPVAPPHARSRAPSSARTATGAGLELPRWLRSGAAAVGWVAILGLFAGSLARGLAPDWTGRGAAPGKSFELGPLAAKAISTAWVPVGRGVTLLVVAGELHNETSAPVRPSGEIVVELLDAAGASLGRELAVAGRPIELDLLREVAAPEFVRMRDGAAMALTSGSVAAGRQVPFAAYFANPPSEARRVAIAVRNAQPIAQPIVAEMPSEAEEPSEISGDRAPEVSELAPEVSDGDDAPTSATSRP